MKKKLVCIFICICSCLVRAEIQVQADPAQVTFGESFKLTITDNDPQNAAVPDLTPLEKDFTIYSTERNISYTVINGQAQTVSQWIIALKPLKAGIVTIPSIKMGMDTSNPLSINVATNATSFKKAMQTKTLSQEGVALTASVDEKKPFVNQEIIYTVRLYNSKRLLDAQYQGPKVEDALLIPLGDAKRYQTILDNVNYSVEEQSYAIFPQKSGTMNIESPVFSALVYDFNPQRIRAEDKKIVLSVQPIPALYKGKTWFPAKEVKVTEKYENASQSVAQGSTLTRVINIEAVGVPAQLLPSLSFEDSDAFNVYPEKGSDKNKVKQGELIGTTEFKVTYLFNKTGKVVLPQLSVPWFNTQTGQDEVAVLAPRSFEVLPSAVTPSKEASVQNDAQAVTPSSDVPAPQNTEIADPTPWYLAFFFALAWLMTLCIWFLHKKGWPGGTQRRGKRALTELSQACKAGDKHKARDALLKWAAIQWSDATFRNLGDVSAVLNETLLKKQIQLLSQALYQDNAQSEWQGRLLLKEVLAFRPSSNIREKQPLNQLPPINPGGI